MFIINTMSKFIIMRILKAHLKCVDMGVCDAVFFSPKSLLPASCFSVFFFQWDFVPLSMNASRPLAQPSVIY